MSSVAQAKTRAVMHRGREHRTNVGWSGAQCLTLANVTEH